MSAEMLEASLLGAGTVLRLESDAYMRGQWSNDYGKQQVSPTPPHPHA